MVVSVHRPGNSKPIVPFALSNGSTADYLEKMSYTFALTHVTGLNWKTVQHIPSVFLNPLFMFPALSSVLSVLINFTQVLDPTLPRPPARSFPFFLLGQI